MNDFTKEELQRIVVWGELHKSGEGIAWPVMGSKKSNKELMKKLQSLIDNYCEHEWHNFCCGCDPENLVCQKCNKDLWGDSL